MLHFSNLFLKKQCYDYFYIFPCSNSNEKHTIIGKQVRDINIELTHMFHFYNSLLQPMLHFRCNIGLLDAHTWLWNCEWNHVFNLKISLSIRNYTLIILSVYSDFRTLLLKLVSSSLCYHLCISLFSSLDLSPILHALAWGLCLINSPFLIPFLLEIFLIRREICSIPLLLPSIPSYFYKSNSHTSKFLFVFSLLSEIFHQKGNVRYST